MSEALVPKRDPIDTLTEKERHALEEHRRKGVGNMAASTAANFFQLYVEGYPLEKMLDGNKAWTLGHVADACVRFDWPAKRDAYVDDLHQQAVMRLRKMQAEAINHIADLLAVANKEFQVEMMRYLQNPIEDNLPKGRLKTAKDYKDLAGALESLSKVGHPELPKDQPSITVNAAAGSQVAVVAPSGDKGGQILSSLGEAAREAIRQSRTPKSKG